MTKGDLPFADSLRALVGWNQTIDDWRRLLDLEPHGCFVGESNGTPVGTATTKCYGSDLAWIGMVLVHPDFRRQGIGRALLQRCLDYLAGGDDGLATNHTNRTHCRCIMLDATPLGQPLYEHLGFREEWKLTRWEGWRASLLASRDLLPGSNSSGTPIRPVQPNDWPALLAFDRRVFGIDRSRVLNALGRTSRVFVPAGEPELTGYGRIRPGAQADYIGPVVSTTGQTTAALITRLVSEAGSQKIFWDLPHPATDAVHLPARLGFIPQRSLVRMVRGENPSPGLPAHQIAIADPASG